MLSDKNRNEALNHLNFMEHLQQNTTLQGGKYRIERVLGQGGFGITYLAVQTSLERNVAIKEFFMKDFCSRDNTKLTTGSTKIVEQCRKKFIKEARNLARLSHPNIIGVIDIFEENDTVYYVMPYLTGGSLEDYVKTHGPLSESEAMKYVRQIASALKYMHEEEHICHYDVKPANILLDNKGNAVLIDFGISKNYDASGHETTTTPIGMSEGYAPIEQYQQNVEEFSPVSDVYALGATLYFLLHGKRPVPAIHRASGTELMISEQFSQEIKDIINSSMKVSKRERANSVDVFLKEVSFSEQSINSNVDSVVTDEETIIASEEDEVPFEMLLKRAEEGDAEAQNELGDCYYYGEKVEENKDQAFIWYKKAAEQGDADAQYSLGWCYENGEGVVRDAQQALMWYKKSAENGNTEAQEILISRYNYGVGVWKKNDANENNETKDESSHVNNDQILKSGKTTSKKRLEDYDEFPLINEALQQCGYYKWERARVISGHILGWGLFGGGILGFLLVQAKKDFSFLSFIDEIPTICLVLFFILFNPLTAIIFANIIDSYIESNQKAILTVVIDGLEIEVPYPVREEFTDRERIV